MQPVALSLAALLVLPSVARPDTVVLKSGKQLKHVVVSRNDDQFVVINPWNSKLPQMTWEVPEKNQIPRDKVQEVLFEDPPRIEYQRRASGPNLTAADHLELAVFCANQKWKREQELHLALALRLEPDQPQALSRFGAAAWATYQRKHPELSPEVWRAARALLEAVEPTDVQDGYDTLKQAGNQTPVSYFERARRSARIPKGRRDQVPLTVNSKEAPGSTYAIQVSSKYDPLTPTTLVIGLHGGGMGGRDDTLVTGSGENALNFYQELAEDWGWIVACPTARKAPWSNAANEPLIDAVLEEMLLSFNIDQRRIYLVGHSMGGFGTWHYGPRLGDIFAACSPCAGGGGPNGIKIPVYIYHGTDDPIVPVGRDRSAAKALSAGQGKSRIDFVYTELDGVGHGFPDAVRQDIFRWFAGRWQDQRRPPFASFERKLTRAEIVAFGDPSSPSQPDSGGDSTLQQLIADLKQGGGAAHQAAEALGQLATPAAARSVAALLKSKRSSVDTQVQAATALGNIGLEECIPQLMLAVKADDFRVVDAGVQALGKIGGESTLPALQRAGRRFGEFFEGSFFGDTITHTEYEVRLGSFGLLLDALAWPGAASTALPLIADQIVEPILDPRKLYLVNGDEDSRFKNASPKARQILVGKLAHCLVLYADPAGVPLLERIRRHWPEDARIQSEIERALAALQ